jgi:hypothetical protein
MLLVNDDVDDTNNADDVNNVDDADNINDAKTNNDRSRKKKDHVSTLVSIDSSDS